MHRQSRYNSADLWGMQFMRHWRSSRCTSGSAPRLLVYMALAALLACQPRGPDASLETYLSMLGATLSVAPADSQFTRASPPPLVESVTLDIPTSHLDGLDFLALSGCSVQATISKRDTSLGRKAKASQRLLLALEYLRLAPLCINRLHDNDNEALADLLQDAWQQQKDQLPALIFNATLGSDEYRAFWLGVPAPGDYPRSRPGAAAAALRTIDHQTLRWLDGDYQAQNRDLELLLSEVAGGNGGALLRALSHQNDRLATANLMLGQRLARSSRCLAGKPDVAVVLLSTVIRKYFTAVLEPRAARLDRRYHQLLSPIAALEAQLAAGLPQPYRLWMDDRNQHFVTLATAPHRHLDQLDQIWQACATD